MPVTETNKQNKKLDTYEDVQIITYSYQNHHLFLITFHFYKTVNFYTE